MSLGPFVRVARVVKTHGAGGEVSMKAVEGLPFVVSEGQTLWFVPPPGEPFSAQVESVRTGPKGPLVKLSGVDDVERARDLAGTWAVIDRADLEGIDLTAPDDAVGLRVIDVDRGELGLVDRVIVTGANDVWVVSGGSFGEVLLPVIDDVVLGIDGDTGVATVRLLPGLLEDGR